MVEYTDFHRWWELQPYLPYHLVRIYAVDRRGGRVPGELIQCKKHH